MMIKGPRLRGETDTTAEESALAALQNENERLKDARDEERFLLVCVIIVLSDGILFTKMDNWAGAIVVGIIEIFAIAVLARRWGIQEVAQILAKFLGLKPNQVIEL